MKCLLPLGESLSCEDQMSNLCIPLSINIVEKKTLFTQFYHLLGFCIGYCDSKLGPLAWPYKRGCW